MLHSTMNFFILADPQVVRNFAVAPAISLWILIPAMIAVVIMIYYLYRRNAGSPRLESLPGSPGFASP